jgi:hypothetical protein
MLRPTEAGLGRATAVLLLATVACAAGCATTQPVVIIDRARLDEAVVDLSRPLPGDLAALYRMRGSKTGGLRLSVITAGDDGRMTITKPFGSAVTLTAWTAKRPTLLFDMDQGCRREVEDLRDLLGLGAPPMGQAVRLLGGRLPAMPGDLVTTGSEGRIGISGAGWAAWVRVAPEPWRVVEVDARGAGGDGGWRMELSEHANSIPGVVRVTNPDGRWVELKLSRIEWPDEAALPALPDFPPCGGS